MSDLMLFGVLRMPYEMAMGDELSRRQFYARAQEAADRLEKAAQSPSQPLVEVQEPPQGMLLPPLPQPDIIAFDEDTETWVRSYSDELMEEHARAAVALNAAAPVRGLPLTEEEIAACAKGCYGIYGFKETLFARNLEVKHGISSSAPGGDGEMK